MLTGRPYSVKVRNLLLPIHTYLQGKLLQKSVRYCGKDGTIALIDASLVSDYLREQYFDLMGVKRGFTASYDVENMRKAGTISSWLI